MDLNVLDESQITFGVTSQLSQYNNGNWSEPDKKISEPLRKSITNIVKDVINRP